jgi:hypothetical protein
MKKNLTDIPSLETVASLMTRVGLLEEEINGGNRDNEYFSNIEKVALGLFRVVVMGEIKKGKSSFINALCATRDLVPVHDNVATSTIFKIHYGEKSEYKVFFLPESGKEKITISADQLGQYGTEDGNPDNREMVDFIAVQSPSQLLKDGFLLIDTPGVGGLFKKHRDITFKYAPKADAVFFVTDSTESPIGADEVSFLKELRNITRLIYFVQTKGADADPDARKRRMENNISILIEQVGFTKEEIRYFVVDSNLKLAADDTKNLEDLQDSGFALLMAYLNNELKPARLYNIECAAIRHAANKLLKIKTGIQQKKIILDAETTQKQAALKGEYSATERKLTEWNNNIRPEIAKEFKTEVQSIQSDITTFLSSKFRPGGELSEEAGTFLKKYQDNEPEEIYQQAKPLADNIRVKASEVMLKISNEVETRMINLLQSLSKKVGSSINLEQAIVERNQAEFTEIRFSQTQLDELAAKGDDPHHFEKMRNAGLGAVGGVTLAHFAGAAIGSVVPVVGTIIGGVVGGLIFGIWAGAETKDLIRGKEASAARASIHAFIERDLSSIHTQVQIGFNKTLSLLSNKVEDAIGDMIKKSIEDLNTNQNLIRERAKATTEEIAQAKQLLVVHESQVASIERELKAIEKRLD